MPLEPKLYHHQSGKTVYLMPLRGHNGPRWAYQSIWDRLIPRWPRVSCRVSARYYQTARRIRARTKGRSSRTICRGRSMRWWPPGIMVPVPDAQRFASRRAGRVAADDADRVDQGRSGISLAAIRLPKTIEEYLAEFPELAEGDRFLRIDLRGVSHPPADGDAARAGRISATISASSGAAAADVRHAIAGRPRPRWPWAPPSAGGRRLSRSTISIF